MLDLCPQLRIGLTCPVRHSTPLLEVAYRSARLAERTVGVEDPLDPMGPRGFAVPFEQDGPTIDTLERGSIVSNEGIQGIGPAALCFLRKRPAERFTPTDRDPIFLRQSNRHRITYQLDLAGFVGEDELQAREFVHQLRPQARDGGLPFEQGRSSTAVPSACGFDEFGPLF